MKNMLENIKSNCENKNKSILNVMIGKESPAYQDVSKKVFEERVADRKSTLCRKRSPTNLRETIGKYLLR